MRSFRKNEIQKIANNGESTNRKYRKTNNNSDEDQQNQDDTSDYPFGIGVGIFLVLHALVLVARIDEVSSSKEQSRLFLWNVGDSQRVPVPPLLPFDNAVDQDALVASLMAITRSLAPPLG